MRKLEGLSIIMMGASGGIGGATALQIAKPGVKIAICSVDPVELDNLAQQLKDKGATVYSKLVDVTKEEQVNAFMTESVEQFGRADILINFAGLSITAKLDELTEAGYDKVMDVNVKGMFLSTKAFVSHVDTEEGALVINFGSMAAKRANAGAPHYSAAKAAVNLFSDGLAQQLKSKNIRVTVINPGPTNTTFFAGRMAEDKLVNFMSATDVAELLEFVMTRDKRIIYHDVMFECFDFYKI